MAVHAWFLAALIAASLGGAIETPRSLEETPLIAADQVLADVDEVQVVLMTKETPQVERLIDAADLTARVSQKLGQAGITAVESDTGTTPRLIVQIEGVPVPDGDKWVYRVQTALARFVTVAGMENRRFQAEVWRVRPVMNAVAGPQAGVAISDDVLVQVEAFIAAREAARKLLGSGKDEPASGLPNQTQTAPQDFQAATTHPFVASKSSNVFHRADCRWAQNITAGNRVGYQTREEAVQSGKRPCKTCKP